MPTINQLVRNPRAVQKPSPNRVRLKTILPPWRLRTGNDPYAQSRIPRSVKSQKFALLPALK